GVDPDGGRAGPLPRPGPARPAGPGYQPPAADRDRLQADRRGVPGGRAAASERRDALWTARHPDGAHHSDADPLLASDFRSGVGAGARAGDPRDVRVQLGRRQHAGDRLHRTGAGDVGGRAAGLRDSRCRPAVASRRWQRRPGRPLPRARRRVRPRGVTREFGPGRRADRALLAALVRDCARGSRPAGLSPSVAVTPRLPGDENATGAALDYYQSWSGAYDFPALARAADYLSVMTYDEHNGVTLAGPVSGIPWMRQALDYTLRDVPPGKAMLGLPTYYHDWTGVGYLTSSSYADALILAGRYHATPTLDPTEDEMHFSYVTRWGVHHELWFESGDTLRQKLPLLYEYRLRGVSVWRLGFEDPAFWDLMVPRR